MKVTLSRTPLLQLVQRCQSIVEKRHTIPILANVLIETNEDSLRMTATDLEVGICSRIEGTVKESGSITVSAKKLFDIIKELDQNLDVSLTTGDGFIMIASGRSRFKVITQSAEAYPAMTDQENATSVILPATALAEMIGATSFAMSTDETRKYLTGTLFELDEEQNIRLVTTDGHRLALSEYQLEQVARKGSCIVPRKAVVEMRKLCDEHQGDVELLINDSQIRLMAGANTLTSKLIDARFPVYQDVIPVDNPDTAKMERTVLDQVLRRNMIVANEFTHDIRLIFSEKGVDISAQNSEQEESDERIDADYTGQEIAIGFNGRYLRDVLSVIHTDSICMELKDELSPILVHGEDSHRSRYVIMPMRI
ncbi:MAG: DNA polymerase III subunit beta [Mariprofundus sp.]|nr:DNA polymerase III subunit beta [Mariprofundus sp.]